MVANCDKFIIVIAAIFYTIFDDFHVNKIVHITPWLFNFFIDDMLYYNLSKQ